MGLVVVTAAASEPVSIADLKSQLRITADDEAALLQRKVKAAREWAERFLNRQLAFPVTYDWKMDDFPFGSSSTWGWSSDRLTVPRPPLQSVTSINYVDANGAPQTFSAANYVVDGTEEPGRIILAYGQAWPTTRMQANAVTIRLVAGATAAHLVPEAIREGIVMLAADLFENRENTVIGDVVNELPNGVRDLLGPYRIYPL